MENTGAFENTRGKRDVLTAGHAPPRAAAREFTCIKGGKESPGKILVGDDDVAEEKTEVPEKLDAPVKSGTPVGQITYLLNGEKWGSCQAVVKETVRRRTFTWIAMKMCEMFYQFNF